jgi:hypothetical protein
VIRQALARCCEHPECFGADADYQPIVTAGSRAGTPSRSRAPRARSPSCRVW